MGRFFLVLILFLTAIPVYPAPSYGTKLPLVNKYFTGIQTHLVFERELEQERGDLRSSQHFLQVSYGLFDWLALDLKIGVGNLKQHPLSSDEVDYNSSFAGGYGLRFKLYDQKKAKLVFGFQHISVHPYSTDLNGIENKAILDDWQVCLSGSYSFLRLTPYLGAKWSRLDYIHWLEQDRKRTMSDLTKGLGLILGVDIPLTDRTWVNFEGELVSGQTLSGSFNISF
ncbi:MAG: hypothetical protein ABIH45_05465 [Candidatus Omnitrophota bacterium]